MHVSRLIFYVPVSRDGCEVEDSSKDDGERE